MIPIPIPVGPSAEKVAKEIIFQERVEKVLHNLRDSNYSLGKVMEYMDGDLLEAALGALMYATEKKEIIFSKGPGKEIWKKVVEKYDSIPFNELSSFEYRKISQLNYIYEPPSWRSALDLGMGLIWAFYALFTMSPIAAGEATAKLSHKLDMNNLKRKLGLHKEKHKEELESKVSPEQILRTRY